MKEIAFVDAVRMNKYFDQTTPAKVNIDSLLRKANSGKNNYDYNDLLNYIIKTIYTGLEEKKAMTNNKLKKHLQILKQYYEVYNKNSAYIGEDVIEKTKSLEKLYINNRMLTGKDGDTETEEILSLLKDLAEQNEQYKNKPQEAEKEAEEVKEEIKQEQKEDPSTPTTEEKSIEEYQSLVGKLQERISLLEKEVSEYQYAMSISTNQNTADEKTINKKNQKIEEYKWQLRIARNDYKKLEKVKDTLEKDLGNAEERASSLNKRLNEFALKINDLNTAITKLNEENERLRQSVIDTKVELQNAKEELAKKDEKLKEISSTVSKEDMIDNFILELLFKRKMSLDSIMNALEHGGFNISKAEALESLKRINNTVNVKPAIGFDKRYGIVEPAIRTNAKMSYPNHKKTFDVICLADYHYDASENSSYLQEKLNSVYDYCAKNEIKSIISLGDLIDNKNIPTELNKENLEIIKGFIKDFDKILPYDVGIKHYILGGNHDKAFLKYGIDPIEELAFEREDTIPLGYSNAFVYFGGSDIIGLHHEGVPRESIVPNYLDSGDETIRYINSVYENARVNPAERYLDLFGHFHKGRIDFANSYAIVPSISNDRNNDGAWHLRFELDSHGRINYIVIYPLVFGKAKELRTSNEIVYQKKRKQ